MCVCGRNGSKQNKANNSANIKQGVQEIYKNGGAKTTMATNYLTAIFSPLHTATKCNKSSLCRNPSKAPAVNLKACATKVTWFIRICDGSRTATTVSIDAAAPWSVSRDGPSATVPIDGITASLRAPLLSLPYSLDASKTANHNEVAGHWRLSRSVGPSNSAVLWKKQFTAIARRLWKYFWKSF